MRPCRIIADKIQKAASKILRVSCQISKLTDHAQQRINSKPNRPPYTAENMPAISSNCICFCSTLYFLLYVPFYLELDFLTVCKQSRPENGKSRKKQTPRGQVYRKLHRYRTLRTVGKTPSRYGKTPARTGRLSAT